MKLNDEPNDESSGPDGDVVGPRSLPNDAVVVRFGLAAPDTLRKTALAHHDERGDFAISVTSLPSKTAEELALTAGLRHPRIRATTVGRIREAGFDVIPDEPPPGHALIMLSRLPADEDYQRISEVFGHPTPNPVVEDYG